jgi:hypothetical protein
MLITHNTAINEKSRFCTPFSFDGRLTLPALCYFYPNFTLIVEGHGVAEVFIAVRNSPAIKADVLGVFCYLFYLIKKSFAGKHANVTLMFSLTFGISHSSPPFQCRSSCKQQVRLQATGLPVAQIVSIKTSSILMVCPSYIKATHLGVSKHLGVRTP